MKTDNNIYTWWKQLSRDKQYELTKEYLGNPDIPYEEEFINKIYHKQLSPKLDLKDVFPFGKYRNQTLENICKINPMYIVWFSYKIDNYHISRHIVDLALKLKDKRKNNQFTRNEYMTSEDMSMDADFGSCFDWGSQ